MASSPSIFDPSAETKNSWAPLVAIALAQVLMSINVSALPISLSGMVESFDVSPRSAPAS
ncbi:hypothetical protein [Streptomyces sp. NPDC005141]